MDITFPPILIPVALVALVFTIWKYWLPAHIKIIQINARSSKRYAIFETIGIPLISFMLLALGIHLTGNDAVFSSIGQGLVWCGQGLIWDLLHPFAYGFGISFS